MLRSGHIPLFLLPLVLCSLPAPSVARQTSVAGSIGTGLDIRDRSYDSYYSNSNSKDQQKISITPTITITSKGLYDQLSFQYSPSLNYDFVDDEKTINQHLRLNAQRMLTSRWKVSVSDYYKYTDDSSTSYYYTSSGDEQTDETGEETETETEDTLSRDQTGRRYWTNAASIRSSYALFENTTLGGGYTYSVLRNAQGSNGSNYDEYDKHAISANLSHDFSPSWRSNIGGNAIRGLYNTNSSSSSSNSDLYQYGLTTGIDYIHSNLDSFPLQYSLSTTDYDSTSRNDTITHEWSVGWRHAFSPQAFIAVGGGPSYAQTEGLDGMWGYNAYLNASKKFQHTTCSLQLSKKFDTNNFSGTDESGVEDTYNARVNLSHQYSKNLGFNMFARYSKQSQIDPQGAYQITTPSTTTKTGDNTYDKDIYETGLGLRYAFWQWYSVGLRYSYYVSDGQLDSDQYNEHRIILSLDMTRELFRW